MPQRQRTRICAKCGKSNPYSMYSKTQWKRRSNAICRRCVRQQHKTAKIKIKTININETQDVSVPVENPNESTNINSPTNSNQKNEKPPDVDAHSIQIPIIPSEYSQIPSEYRAISAERNTLLGYGYISLNEKQYNITIPVDLILLLIRFLGGLDVWDKHYGCSPFIAFDSTQQSIIHKASNNGTFCSAYLSNLVKYGKHCWIFEIEKMRNKKWSIIIGIWNVFNEHDEQNHLITQNYPFLTKHSGYCYFVYDRAVSNVNCPYQLGRKAEKKTQIDTVSMIVDLDHHTVNFKVNNELQYKQCPFNNIMDGMYRAVVTLTQKDNRVKLLSYQQLQ
eukprot:92428_1